MTSMSHWLTRGVCTRCAWSASATARMMNALQNYLSSQNFSLRFRHITLTMNESFHLCKASGQRNQTCGAAMMLRRQASATQAAAAKLCKKNSVQCEQYSTRQILSASRAAVSV